MAEEKTFSVCTWNILAPCYDTLCSADQSRKRLPEIIKTLQSLDTDIFCLQEFWLTDEMTVSSFSESFKKDYNSVSLKRTGKSKEDGLAIFFRKEIFELVYSDFNLLKDRVGNRVSIMLHLNCKKNNLPLIILNTHLTFPHNDYDEYTLRVNQINQILKGVENYIQTNFQKSNLEFLLIFCGDFNNIKSDPQNDVIYQILEKSGFSSSFKNIHKQEPKCTHKNHNNDLVCCDWIFFKSIHSSVTVKDSKIFPFDLSHEKWPLKGFSLSDHRPIISFFE